MKCTLCLLPSLKTQLRIFLLYLLWLRYVLKVVSWSLWHHQGMILTTFFQKVNKQDLKHSSFILKVLWLFPMMIPDFPSKREKVLHVFSRGGCETRLSYELTGCGSSGISCKESSTIAHTFTHEQLHHPTSRKRHSLEISALDRSSNVAPPLFIRPISLSSRLFFFSPLVLFRPMTFPLGDARPILKEL